MQKLVLGSVLWPSMCFGAALAGAAIPLVGAGIAVPFLLTGAVFSVAEPCSAATDEYKACPWDSDRLGRAAAIALGGIAVNATLGGITMLVAARMT